MQKKIITAMLGSLLLGGAALYFLIIGLVSISHRIDLLTNAVYVTGTVVSVDGNDESHYPTISFKTADGQTQQFTSTVNGDYKEKDEIPVVYQSTNPQRASINNFGSLWVAVVFQLVGGVLFLLGSLVPLRALLKYRWWFGHRRIMAPISEVKEITDPGATYYQLFSHWVDPATDRNYVFQSGELEFDPRQNGQGEIAIDIDPHNPANYYIDKNWLKQSQKSVLKPV